MRRRTSRCGDIQHENTGQTDGRGSELPMRRLPCKPNRGGQAPGRGGRRCRGEGDRVARGGGDQRGRKGPARTGIRAHRQTAECTARTLTDHTGHVVQRACQAEHETGITGRRRVRGINMYHVLCPAVPCGRRKGNSGGASDKGSPHACVVRPGCPEEGTCA